MLHAGPSGFCNDLRVGTQSSVLHKLPLSVLHRLGFLQQPFVLDWQQAPPASSHSRVRSILVTAVSLGCLKLRAKLQVCTHGFPASHASGVLVAADLYSLLH